MVAAVVVYDAADVGAAIATAGAVPSVIVTVTLSVLLLPAASLAVTVMTLAPGFRTTPATVHAVVPEAVPLPPRSFDQVTCVTPNASEAVPPIASESFPVE